MGEVIVFPRRMRETDAGAAETEDKPCPSCGKDPPPPHGFLSLIKLYGNAGWYLKELDCKLTFECACGHPYHVEVKSPS